MSYVHQPNASGDGVQKKVRRRTCDERKLRYLRRDDHPCGGDVDVHDRVHLYCEVDAHTCVERRGVRGVCGAADAHDEHVTGLVEVDRWQLLVQHLVGII